MTSGIALHATHAAVGMISYKNQSACDPVGSQLTMKEQTEVVRDAMQARDDIQLGLVASRTCQRHDGTTVRGTKLRCNPSVRPSLPGSIPRCVVEL